MAWHGGHHEAQKSTSTGPVAWRTSLAKENSFTTVVWNPWVQKAGAMSDFGDAEWRQMICIEASNVSDFAVILAPGQQHRMKAPVRLAGF
jgi:glucose-6-phosphate 1-epimerase